VPSVSSLRSPAVLVGTLGALVGLVLAVVLYRTFGAGEVQYGPRGYVVESDTLVQVEFEVVKDPAATAVCAVRSRGGDGSEVGSALVRVGPAPERRQVVTHPLPTTARAVSGEITGCSLQPAGSAPPSP
jgi:hypothetical protein